jgi:hypothetical protein
MGEHPFCIPEDYNKVTSVLIFTTWVSILSAYQKISIR